MRSCRVAYASRPDGRRGASAFTLVEAMIVVIVIAIVAVLAAPKLTATNASRLDAAGKMLVADLQFAQMYALSHADTRCAVKVHVGGESYSVVTNAATPFNCTSATILTDVVTDAAYTNVFGSGRAVPAKNVTVSGYSLGGDNCVVFGSLGELDQATTATITLQVGAKTRVVSIDPISGIATLGS
jgi:Tfp pilus assembly protein FimT